MLHKQFLFLDKSYHRREHRNTENDKLLNQNQVETIDLGRLVEGIDQIASYYQQ